MVKPSTPTDRYFTAEVAARLKETYAIKSMEQLISIAAQEDDPLQGIAKSVGMKDGEFRAVIARAGQIIKVPERSQRSFPLGAN